MFNTIFESIANTINNSKFLSVICAVIVILVAIRALIYVIHLFADIRRYVNNKSNAVFISNTKNTNPDNASLSMPERVEFTNSILDLISFMINNEIVTHMKKYISLENPYNISDLDVDSEKISTIVFNGINKNLFKDPNLILTEQYLMEFITKKTINTLIDITQKYNEGLRGNNQDEED